MAKGTTTQDISTTSSSQESSSSRSKGPSSMRLSLRRKSNPDATTDTAVSKSSGGRMLGKLRPLARVAKYHQRARTTGTIGKGELAEKQIGSIEFLHNKGLDSSDFVPRQEHPLLAAAEVAEIDQSGKTEASSETTTMTTTTTRTT